VLLELRRLRELLDSSTVDKFNGLPLSSQPLALKKYDSLSEFKDDDKEIQDDKMKDMVSK